MKNLKQHIQEKLQITRNKSILPPLEPGQYYSTLGNYATWYCGADSFEEIDFEDAKKTMDLWFYLYNQDGETDKEFNSFKELIEFVKDHKDDIAVFTEEGHMLTFEVDGVVFDDDIGEEYPDDLKINPKTH